MKNFIEELKWRNMLHDIIPGTEELLQKQSVKGYIGFDPTADSQGRQYDKFTALGFATNYKRNICATY